MQLPILDYVHTRSFYVHEEIPKDTCVQIPYVPNLNSHYFAHLVTETSLYCEYRARLLVDVTATSAGRHNDWAS